MKTQIQIMILIRVISEYMFVHDIDNCRCNIDLIKKEVIWIIKTMISVISLLLLFIANRSDYGSHTVLTVKGYHKIKSFIFDSNLLESSPKVYSKALHYVNLYILGVLYQASDLLCLKSFATICYVNNHWHKICQRTYLSR